MSQPAYYGGQAVLEGVMIRGPEAMSVACRRPNGRIAIRTQPLDGFAAGPTRRVPFLRGVLALWETLSLGMRALRFSSDVSRESADGDGEATEFPQTVFWGSIAVAVAFIAAVFFASPMLLSNLLEMTGAHRFAVVGFEGVLRMGMFVGYIVLIGRIPGIRRVFQYHGAEHMTVHAHEAGAPLTPESLRGFPKEHTRCGTSFLLVVMCVALVTFFVFDLLVDEGFVVRAASRVLLLIPIAAVAYELLRLGARFNDNRVVRAFFLPNIGLQALTTKVPDDDQIEVALASFYAILAHTAPQPVPAHAEVAVDVAIPANALAMGQ